MEQLTESELLVMKCIWDAEQPISSLEISQNLENFYRKVWKRTTISTFLLHLTEKGFLSSEKKGWTVYYQPRIRQEEYLQKQTKGFLDFWYQGEVENLVSFLCGNEMLQREELERLKRCLDGMDGLD